MIEKQDALDYHSRGRKGKIEVIPSKPCQTQRDLSLAYTPGVAEPCREIEKNCDKVFDYTAKGNLVAVISNGTAVLGLGDIGPLAGKPVMEGKGVLFKKFADIDVFDIELDSKDPKEIINAVKLMEPTFGGINLEDIKAPECFEIEEELKKIMNIPVFHDDQHGTAIISGAALLNAVEISGKKFEDIKIVFNGAGAAGIACARFYLILGAKKENITICDSKGIVFKGRTEGMNKYKEEFAIETDLRTLEDALNGADVFVGLSVKGAVTKEMVKKMAKNPIIFAMANPDPEITYQDAKDARPDVIMATGRSDFPNQVNNVLGFPFIFRGALDVRAKAINDDMKVAAAYALSRLAKEDVPDAVTKAYGVERLYFGPDYIIPKPLDHRVLLWVAPAVAKAAMESGVAQRPIEDFDAYISELEAHLSRSREVMRGIINKAKLASLKRIVFPEGENEQVIRAARIILEEKIAYPILIGNTDKIREKAGNLGLDITGAKIINPIDYKNFSNYVDEFYKMRQRKGVLKSEAVKLMQTSNYFSCMMVHKGDADGLVSGLSMYYRDTLKPALRIIRVRPDVHRVAGMYMLIFKEKTFFLADTTVNINPTAEELAEIAILTAETAIRLGEEPRVAMLSFSNFGSIYHEMAEKVRTAVEIIKKKAPGLMVDGEMQANTAVDYSIIETLYPFSDLKKAANVLIFPDVQSANIATKLLDKLSDAEAIGPILMGMKKPVHILHNYAEVKDIVNLTAICALEAHSLSDKLIYA